jgi:hypothetical protein
LLLGLFELIYLDLQSELADLFRLFVLVVQGEPQFAGVAMERTEALGDRVDLGIQEQFEVVQLPLKRLGSERNNLNREFCYLNFAVVMFFGLLKRIEVRLMVLNFRDLKG